MKCACGIALFLIILVFYSCENQGDKLISIETPDWTESTHGNSAEPDYSTVFSQTTIQRLDIVITLSDWKAIQDDLADMPHPAPGAALDAVFDPVWVPCGVFYNAIQWYKAGIRVKGNSSLQSALAAGIKKLSFKLDFDQYEETYPAIQNQRFFGFKQLNLNNNFEDLTFMREKVTGDLFREFGVPSARSAFYEVYIDCGSGPQYFGLYTVVEEVDDTVISTQFTDYSGNLYKPEGKGATFAYGTFDTGDFYKKTNEDLADWSDVKALYDAVNSTLRTSDPLAWRALLETKINIDTYIRWLAANTVMQNWDTYGKMNHNYYLYNDPVSSKFIWIPWDNNEALQSGKMGGAINLDLSGVGNQWPFINYIASDAYYYALYKQYIAEFATSVFEPSKMEATIDLYYALIRESAMKENSPYSFLRNDISHFDTSVDQLKQHVNERYSLALSLLTR